MSEKRLLSVDELSAYLSLPKPTIYSWVSMRRIPGVVRLGRALRFEKQAVDRWVDAGESAGMRRGAAAPEARDSGPRRREESPCFPARRLVPSSLSDEKIDDANL